MAATCLKINKPVSGKETKKEYALMGILFLMEKTYLIEFS